MAGEVANKVYFGSTKIMDISDTTAVESDVAQGKRFYLASGKSATGTASGGGKNIQAYMGQDYVRASSYTATDVALTVKKSGTYKISWSGFRNTTSGTSGSRLYINDSAYGSAVTSFTSSYGQNVVLNSVQLNANDALVVRARARNSSYYMYVSNLIIEEQ